MAQPPKHSSATVVRDVATMDLRSDGYYLPYSPELAKAGADTMYSFIDRYLFGCLGTTMETTTKALSRLRSFLPTLSNTLAGEQISHWMACQRLALMGQGTCIVLVDNEEYAGCIVKGPRRISIDGVQYEPTSAKEILSAIRTSSPHQVAVNYLTSIHAWDSLHPHLSMLSVRNQLVTMALSEDERAAIRHHAKDLFFEDRPDFVTEQTIAALCAELADLESSLDRDHYIPSSMVLETSDWKVRLGFFGDNVPTFPYRIPRYRLRTLDSATRCPTELVYRTVSLAQALEDWSTLIESHKFPFLDGPKPQLPRQAKKISSGTDTLVWKNLLDGINKIQPFPRTRDIGKADVQLTGKRARSPENDEDDFSLF